MAEEEAMMEGLNQEQIDRAMLDAPVPGMSLTNSPDTPMPFETPPEIVNYEDAQEYIFDMLMEGSDGVIDVISMGVPVSMLATSVVMKGFAQGKWNTDLMLLLIEPTIYIMLFIAEQAGVEYVLDFDEEFETLPAEARVKAEGYIQKATQDIIKQVEEKTEGANIQELMPPSLLAKAEETA